MKKQQIFKKRRLSRWLIMLLFAVFIATGGISSTAMAAAAAGTIRVENGSGGAINNPFGTILDAGGNLTNVTNITATGTLQGGSLNITGDATITGNLNVGNYSFSGNNVVFGDLIALEANENVMRGNNVNLIQGTTNISSSWDINGNPTGNIIHVDGVNITALTADGAGLTINQSASAPGVVSLLNVNGEGLKINPTNTILSGGTNSSSWDMGNSVATLAVGTASLPEVSLIRATNTYDGLGGGSTNVSIGEANGNRVDVNSSTGTTVTGNFTANGNTNQIGVYANSTNNIFGTLNQISASTENYIGSERLNVINAPTNYIYGATTLDSTPWTGGGNTLTVAGTGIQANVMDGTNNAVFGLGALPAGFSSYGTGAYIAYNNTATSTAYGLYADDRSVNVGYLSYNPSAAPVYHGLQVTDTETTLSGGTNSSTLTLANAAATLAVGTASAPETTVLTATNNGVATAINISSNSFNVDTNNTNGVVIPNVGGTGVLSVADGNTYIGSIDQTLSYVNGLATNDHSATLRGGGSSGSTAMTLDGTGATITGASGTTFKVDNLGNTTMGIDATTTATINGALLVDSNGTGTAGGNTFVVNGSGVQASAPDANGNGVLGVGALPAPYGAYGPGAYIAYENTNTNTAYGLFADGSGVNVGYINAGGYEGLQVENSHTTLTGGSHSSSLTLANAAATLAVGTASAPEVAVFTATNNGSTTDVNISSNTLTVGAATTINNSLLVDSNGAAPGGNTFVVNGSGIQASAPDANGNAVLGVGALPAPYGAYGPGAYIGYQNTSTNTVYGLFADGSGVNVGYINAGGYEGLQVENSHTTLTGGSNSSSLTLANAAATLAVGTASAPEVAVLTATNNGSTTDVNISSNTLTVGAATTINNSLLVDSNGTGTAGGNTLTVNGSGVSARSDSGSFGMDVNNSVAQIGFSNGTTTNGLAATSSNVAATSTNATLDSATLSLAVGDKAYISYYDSSNKTEYGLSADDTRTTVGSINYNTGNTYGMTATNSSVFVGSVIGGQREGLTVDGTTNTTKLTGGTNSSSLTLADNKATLAVGTASSSEIALVTATNSGSGTNVAIGDTANNYVEVDSATGTTVHGNLAVTGNLTVNGTTFSGDDITTNGDLTVAGHTKTDSLEVTNDATVGGDLTVAGHTKTDSLEVTNDATVGGDLTVAGHTNLNGGLSVSDIGPNYTSSLDVDGLNGVHAAASTSAGTALLGLGGGTSFGDGAYIGYQNTSTNNVYGLFANGSSVNVGYYNPGSGYMEGLTIHDTYTKLSGGSNSSSLTLANAAATLAVGTASSPEVTVLTATNNGSTTDVNISSTTLTVSAATTINNTLHVTGVTNLDSDLHVGGNETVAGTLDVTGHTNTHGITNTGNITTDSLTVNNNATIGGTLNVAGLTTTNGIQNYGDINNTGKITTGTLEVTGATKLDGTLDVYGATELHDNLIVDGTTTLNGATTINNTLHVTGIATLDSDVNVGGNLDVTGNTDLTGTLHVTGLTTTNGIVNNGNITTDSLTVNANATVGGTLDVTGATTLHNTLDVTGATTLHDTLTVDGATTLNGATTINNTLHVTGNTTLDSNLDVGGNETVAGTLNVAGLTTTHGILNHGNITTDTLDVTGNATVGGTLAVTGATTLGSTLTVAGATTLNSTLTVAGATTLNGATTINNTLHVTGDTTLDSDLIVYGATTLHDDLAVVGLTTTHGITNTGNITTDTLTTTGDAAVGGNLSVAGNETVTGNLAVTGTATTHGITNTGSLISNGGDVVLSTNSGNPGNASLRLTDDSGASLLYTNVSGNTHGLTIGESSTVLTGGTTSTSLTLNDAGATFANVSTGNPVRVTGIADGVNDYDAVNVRQLHVYEKAVEKANIGIASVSALAAIPGTMPCKRFAVGVGYGYFESESALALGMKAKLWDFLSVQAGVGFGLGNDDNTYSANAGLSFSF